MAVRKLFSQHSSLIGTHHLRLFKAITVVMAVTLSSPFSISYQQNNKEIK